MKKTILPPQILEQQIAKLLPDFRSRADAERAKTAAQMPPWCWIDCAWVFREYAKYNMPFSKQKESNCYAAHMLALWNLSRVVYDYDETLKQSLIEQEIPTVPVDALMRLPQYCVCILDPPERDAVALYCCLNYDPISKKAELIMLYQYSDGQLVNDNIMLEQDKSIAECIELTIKMSQDYMSSLPADFANAYGAAKLTYKLSGKILSKIAARISDAMNMLLYIVADNAETHTERERVPKTPSPLAPDAAERPNRMTPYSVGVRIGSAIRAARQESAQNETHEHGHHASPIAHIRSGHFHSFRCGKGRTDIVVHWLPPMLVAAKDGAQPVDTIRPVK